MLCICIGGFDSLKAWFFQDSFFSLLKEVFISQFNILCPTKALLSSIPVPDPEKEKERIILKGDIPSPIDPPSGCRFHTRCPFATDLCKTKEPELNSKNHMKAGHEAACHYIGQLSEVKVTN